MMPQLAAHDWFGPKLGALVAEAEAAGFARDVAVAVITDLINGPQFNTAPLETDETWNQDIGEPDYMVNPDGTRATNAPDQTARPDPMPFIGSRGEY
jgi:hypothetical protein